MRRCSFSFSFLLSQAVGQSVDFSLHGKNWAAGNCKSRDAQSPISIDFGIREAAKEGFQYFYPPAENEMKMRWQNGGLELKFDEQRATPPEGMFGYVDYRHRRYDLKKMVLKAKSEHLVDGKRYPIEVQLHHHLRGIPAEKLNLSLFFEGGDAVAADYSQAMVGPPAQSTEADFNVFLQKLIGKMQDSAQGAIEVKQGLNLSDLFRNMDLTGVKKFVKYHGSVSTPPCTEGTQWFVAVTQPNLASTNQIANLAAYIHGNTSGAGNWRDIMPIGEREMKPVFGVELSQQTPIPIVPTPQGPYPTMPSGPKPRTETELKLVNRAKTAIKKANGAVEHVKEIKQAMVRAAKKKAKIFGRALLLQRET